MSSRGGIFEMAEERVKGGIPGRGESVCKGKGVLGESHGEMPLAYL